MMKIDILNVISVNLDHFMKDTYPIIKPDFSKIYENMIPDIEKILKSNKVTGVNKYVKTFENKVNQLLKTNSIALSSCTSGMILSIEALKLRNSEIIMPSFSFSASAHMAYWNNCRIVFADINQKNFNIDPDEIKKLISPQTKAILAVHMYGNPAPINQLKEIAEDHNLKLLFDAAHAFGSEYNGISVANFGDSTSFSLSPTKVISSIEGGIVTSGDDEFLDKLDILRNYGNDVNYNCPIPGLNARMSEIHAAIGIHSLSYYEEFLKNRIKIAKYYEEKIQNIDGLVYQIVEKNQKSTYKDFSVVINPKLIKKSRDSISARLLKSKISTKYYFYPPIHHLKPYQHCRRGIMKNTEFISNNVLSLPIWNSMTYDDVDYITQKLASAVN